MQLVAAAVDAETPYTQADLAVPTAIAVGAEDAGLPEAWREAADLTVSIPLRGARPTASTPPTAAAILLFEAVRQRG